MTRVVHSSRVRDNPGSAGDVRGPTPAAPCRACRGRRHSACGLACRPDGRGGSHPSLKTWSSGRVHWRGSRARATYPRPSWPSTMRALWAGHSPHPRIRNYQRLGKAPSGAALAATGPSYRAPHATEGTAKERAFLARKRDPGGFLAKTAFPKTPQNERTPTRRPTSSKVGPLKVQCLCGNCRGKPHVHLRMTMYLQGQMPLDWIGRTEILKKQQKRIVLVSHFPYAPLT